MLLAEGRVEDFMRQKTINRSIDCSGIGLHSGRKVRLTLRPAEEDSGVRFVVVNDSGRHLITPSPEAVVSTQLATTLHNGAAAVSTVEHLLASVRALGIDNIEIELDGSEVPIMDGSAASFVYLLRLAGLRSQTRPAAYLAVTETVELEKDGKYVRAEPYDGFRVDYTIDFPHPLIGRQAMSFELTPEAFARRLAKARTFGFVREVEYLRSKGLALGGSLDNAVVLDEDGVINADGLRFKDEFVRHKILDFIGDTAVLEAPLKGRFEVFASGHGLNNAFVRKLWSESGRCLERVVPDAGQAPSRRPHLSEPLAQPAAAVA
jgi:UDP-3-O-[3-hydroxymyristoyl] N-acetylglucosamine deacetylase